MATHKSALKRHRQSLKRRVRNRQIRGAVRKAIKRTRMYAESGDIANAQAALHEAISRLDIAAKKGVLHKNNVARRKSRLTRLVNKVAAQQ